MKLTVIKKHIAELIEVDEGVLKGCPIQYQSPYFVVLQGGPNAIARFEFLTRQDVLRDNGKRKYFDVDINKAERFESFNEGIEVARKFKTNDITGKEKFYIIGYMEALIVEMKIENNIKSFNQIIQVNDSE